HWDIYPQLNIVKIPLKKLFSLVLTIHNLSVGLQSSKTTSAVTKTTAYRAVGLSQLNSTHRVQIVRNGSQNVGGPYNVVYGEIYVFKNLNINAGDRVSLRVFNDEAYNRTLSGKFEADHAGD
ncbi:hypothetical protein ABHC40_12455, partial [Turicibacter sanguinis]